MEVQLHLFINSALDANERSTSNPDRLPPSPPRKNPGIHGTRGWVSPRAGKDSFEENARAPAGIRTRTVQPVANR